MYIPELLVNGGDERVFIHEETQRNKYHLHPADYTGLLNRGSCTCNTLTPHSGAALEQLHEALKSTSFKTIKDEHTQRLKKCLSYPDQDKFELFFAPSGSDLAYYPLLFAQLLYPEKKILNLLTCPEELGSGTQVACAGNYFMGHTQFAEQVPLKSPLSSSLNIEVKHFPARNKEGFIHDNKPFIKQTIKDHPDHVKIGSLVMGSKSGIEDNLNVISEVKTNSILWVVDLCQFRNKKKLINQLLDMDAMVMITGSKFFQAPPFCGALMVPKSIVNKLAKSKVKVDPAYTNLFSKYDLPNCLPNLQAQFRDHQNLGLLYRWEAAISEMEAFDQVLMKDSLGMISAWNQYINQELERRDCFHLMPDQGLTNKSIISFRVKTNGKFWDNAQLKELFRKLVTTQYEDFHGMNRVFIGQPVNYGDRSFIRLAIGSYNIRRMLEKEKPFLLDEWLLNILEEKIRTYAKQID